MKEADRPGTPAPPVAEARPSSYTVHGITVEDPYRWLKDDNFPTVGDEAVLAYLNAENAYFDAVMAARRELVATLYAELKAREQPDDADVPIKDGRFYYQARFEEGGQYRIWSRWPAQAATSTGERFRSAGTPSASRKRPTRSSTRKRTPASSSVFRRPRPRTTW